MTFDDTTLSFPLSYEELYQQIEGIASESNAISTMANISSFLFHAFKDSDKYLTQTNQQNNSSSSTNSTIGDLVLTPKNINWFGFYLRSSKSNELVLGPFHGKLACTRIRKGKGVCGTSWDKMQTIIVPDVHKIENHIACDSASQSEIVVPLIVEKSSNSRELIGVIDVDSSEVESFGECDRAFFERIAQLLIKSLDWSVVSHLSELINSNE